MSIRTLDSSNIPTMLTFMGTVPNDGKYRWAIYACECGWLGRKRFDSVNNGETRSCGCLRRCLNKKRFLTHGHTAKGVMTNTYRTWADMTKRCSNPLDNYWHRYGGRGITVCERWKSFENFLSDMGDRPIGKSLDRIDNDKGYFAENCKWSSAKEQAGNTSRSIRFIFNGETLSLSVIAAKSGINYHTLFYRIRNLGWTVERAVETPVKGKIQ